MDPALVRIIGSSIEAKLLFFRPKKSKGNDKAWPSTSAVTAAFVGDDLSYHPLAHTILGVTL